MSLIESKRVRHIEMSLLRIIMAMAPPDAVNMALGELGFAMPQGLRDYAAELLKTETPRYTANAGIPELKEAVAHYHHNAYSPEGVCVTNGAEEAIYAAMMAFLNPGDKIAIVEPFYPAYATIVGICEAELVPLPHEPNLTTINWDKWERLLAQNVKVLLFSNPSNPLGTFFSEAEINRICLLAKKYELLILADEIYHDLYIDTEPVSFAGKIPNLILISGVSKSYCMSGWRMGWAIGPEKLVNPIIRAHQYISTCAGWLAQKVTVKALKDGQVWLDEVRSHLRKTFLFTINHLQKQLSSIPLLLPTSTPYIMLQFGGDDYEACSRAAKHGVITVPGRAFGTNSTGWIRINYALEQPLLERGLSILTKQLSSL